MPEQAALLAAAENLQRSAEELATEFKRVDHFAHETAKAHTRTRTLTYWILAGLLTHLIVIVVLAVTFDRANDANSRSVRTIEYQVASCEVANEVRAAQLALWTDVTALIRSTSGPSGRSFAAKVQARAAEGLAPRDCSKVTQGKVR